jgi:membrane-bound lytic murein transglycosylase D
MARFSRQLAFILAVTLGVLLSGTPGWATARLPVWRGLVPNVEFWKLVYSEFTSAQAIVHDRNRLGVVYEIVDYGPTIEAAGSVPGLWEEQQPFLDNIKAYYQGILLSIAKKWPRGPFSAEERRVRRLFGARASKAAFLEAAEDGRIRVQWGLKDGFREAIERSRLYMPMMEGIFLQHGLPTELTRLVFVESMCNPDARSSAGAAGMWQFMKGTARSYDLRVTRHIDERKDPWKSTDAAARLLKDNYERLGTWPLALTAYNHGTYGMVRASNEVGSNNLMRIIAQYQGPSFGFASKNFYSEFLAALWTYENRHRLFGDGDVSHPLRYQKVELPTVVSLAKLTRRSGISTEDIARLNPSLSKELLEGRAYLPKGYALNVPKGKANRVVKAYQSLPKKDKSQVRSRPTAYVWHKVRPGETLYGLSRRYNVPVQKIASANGLSARAKLRVGQSLKIAGGRKQAVIHKVRPGETLYGLSRRYGVPHRQIASWNGISPNAKLKKGQVLRIPRS